jgi:hypothetical protein
MPQFTYNYTSFKIPPSPAFPNGQTIYRPLLLATLKATNGKIFRSLAWPDSGADQCLFPLSLAIALNLDLSKMKRQLTGGVGASENITYYEDLEIDVGNGLKFISYVGFTQGLEAQGTGLLGQSGFFQNFLVTFDYHSRRFWLETR